MVRLLAPATTRSNFLSLFTSPITIFPAPPGTEIGEPDAGVNNACWVCAMLAFPDWHEVNTKQSTVAAINKVGTTTATLKTRPPLQTLLVESRASIIRRTAVCFL